MNCVEKIQKVKIINSNDVTFELNKSFHSFNLLRNYHMSSFREILNAKNYELNRNQSFRKLKDLWRNTKI